MEQRTLSLISILEIHNLSSGAARALMGLLSFRNKATGQCCPKVATLGQRLGGVPERTLRRWLRELRLSGAVEVRKHRGSNSYRFSTNCGNLPVETCEKPIPDRPKVAAQDRPKVAAQDRPKVAGLAGSILYEQTVFELTLANGAPPPPPATPARKPPARSPVARNGPEESDLAVVKESLNGLAEAIGMPVPDDDLVRRVLEAGCGATGTEVHTALVRLWKGNRLKSMRSWGLIPTLIRDCFKATASTGESNGFTEKTG